MNVLTKVSLGLLAVVFFIFISFTMYNSIYKKGVKVCRASNEVVRLRANQEHKDYVKTLKDEIKHLSTSNVSNGISRLYTTKDKGKACRQLCGTNIRPKQEHNKRIVREAINTRLQSEEEDLSTLTYEEYEAMEKLINGN